MTTQVTGKEQTLSTRSEGKAPVIQTSGVITIPNRLDHLLAYIGYRRGSHRVTPGLYAIGNPTAESPVAVTSNYTLSFDAVRSALDGFDSYILVLDTHGVNVWCAAGKKTFGTDELVRRIKSVGLKEIVAHRHVIVPQLGGPGMAAHLVKKGCGFKVIYGPVKASDLPEFIKTGVATKAMRKVEFPLAARLLLVPVEIRNTSIPIILVAATLYLIGGALMSFAGVMAILAGVILFPALLPWLPTPNFMMKGFILGLLVATPFAAMAVINQSDAELFTQLFWAITPLLLMPPATAYFSLNFTGSTPYTSATGVRREIFQYTRPLVATFGAGLIVTAWLFIGSL